MVRAKHVHVSDEEHANHQECESGYDGCSVSPTHSLGLGRYCGDERGEREKESRRKREGVGMLEPARLGRADSCWGRSREPRTFSGLAAEPGVLPSTIDDLRSRIADSGTPELNHAGPVT